jgi:DNA-binding NarL/FixJ family response regulator
LTRILLADDHAMVRRGLRLVLDSEPDLEVVAEAGEGAEAVERALRNGIDLAVLDVTMPRMTGIQAVRELARRKPDLRKTWSRPAARRCAASRSSTRARSRR